MLMTPFLLLTDLNNSIFNLSNLIDTFGSFSGFKVNETKSSIMFLNKQERLNPVINHPFNNAVNGFKYLGITITPAIKDLVPSNYEPMISTVTESINNWSSMPISLIGRINVITMNMLPKFLYLFKLSLYLAKQAKVWFFVFCCSVCCIMCVEV